MIVSSMAAIATVASVSWLTRSRVRPAPRPRSIDSSTDSEPRESPPRHWRRLALVTAAVAVAVSVGPLLALALGIAGVGWPSLRRARVARADRRRVDAAIPDAIDMLILLIHAGLTPHQAIAVLAERAPGPVRPALGEVRRRISRGAPLTEALGALPELLGPSVAVVADTLAMSERYGTPIARALEQLALDVRERRRRRAEADARKLPIRLAFPLVCCTLPSFVLLAIVPAVLAAMASLDTTGL